MSARSLAAFAFAAAGSIAAPAAAQTFGGSAGEWNVPYGSQPGAENRIVSPGTRDANGNRLIVDGRIVTESDASSLPPQLRGDLRGSGVGSATAIGNQLNVVTQGDWNTVIVDSTQINNGDVVARAQGETLNGEIDLDD